MAIKGNTGENRTRTSTAVFIVFGLWAFFYLLGAWQRSRSGKGDFIALQVIKQTDCSVLSNLVYDRSGDAGTADSGLEVIEFKPCDDRYLDYTPCHDQMRAMTFLRENMNYRERHCPPEEENLHCFVPAPKGYATPFPWPKSRDYVPFANAPYKSLTVEKAVQNWIQYEGNVFRFPGCGTQFSHGADAYINQLATEIPLDNRMVRTVLDTGCGTADWLRAETHWEGQPNVRYADNFKRKFAEQEFVALKRRCIRQQNGRKSTCIVAVRRKEPNVKHTVIKRVVGIDLSIRQLLVGENYHGERVNAPLFCSINRNGDSRYGYVSNLCVAKSACRQGIAVNMLRFAIQSAKLDDVEHVYVHLHRHNKGAQDLYEKMGFDVIPPI